MRPIDPVALTRELVDIPSTSGQEGALAQHLGRTLEDLGYAVRFHEVEPGRPNLLATRGEPRVLLCTHLDTVPPYIGCTEDATHLHGRGTCDAKGILAAMVAAGQRLAAEGAEGYGFLLTVAEETDSLGAKRANAELGLAVQHLIVGEPTGNELAIAQKGIVTARLRCEGQAAHGGYPKAGRSAVRALAGVVHALYEAEWGRSEDLGEDTLNVGRIEGGVAVNVLAPEATADLQVRVATSVAQVEARLRELVGGRAEIELRQAAEPLHLERVPGWPTTVVGFGTDLPYLTRFGRRYLLGPGSILDAHTPHERVSKAELLEAVGLYEQLVSYLLRVPAGAV